MPFCTGAQPQYFELDIIDELSVSYTLGQPLIKNSDLYIFYYYFQSTVRRDVLDMIPEVGLLSNVLENNRYSLSQYGHLVAESVNR